MFYGGGPLHGVAGAVSLPMAPRLSTVDQQRRNRAARCSYLLEVTTRCEVVWEWRSPEHLDFATDIITLQDYRGRVDTRQYRGRTAR